MIFCLYTDHGALNSQPVFQAFAQSAIDAGHKVIYNEPYRVMDHYDNYDVAVIWSVLWYGRMSKNKQIWDISRRQDKPVIVLEVGGIKRNNTWKVGLNGINRDAFFGDTGNNEHRANLLRLKLQPWRKDGEHILICGQHERSWQWNDMPRMSKWVMNTIEEIQQHTSRPICFRPHPRCPLPEIEHQYKNVYRQEPRKLSSDRYDDNYDLDFTNTWATISWNSNPGVHSVLAGVPAFTGASSLAYEVANSDLSQIENPVMPDRTQWLNDYAWTEFSIKEIKAGIPLKRLTKALNHAIL